MRLGYLWMPVIGVFLGMFTEGPWMIIGSVAGVIIGCFIAMAAADWINRKQE